MPNNETRNEATDPPSEGQPKLRQVKDARSLRALTHPVRIALIEALSVYGPMTATEAAEQVGESPSSCSFHLRQLAKYGFVEEAGQGPGRRRPWKMTSIGMTLAGPDLDPAAEIASDVLLRLLRDRQLERFDQWRQTRGNYPAQWRDAEINDEHLFWITAKELEALAGELMEKLLPLYRDRLVNPAARPEGALPVELMVLGYPISPPPPNPE